ncbi:hypothetical protein ACOSP7_028027 [Xanthoceras sorbifolium]
MDDGIFVHDKGSLVVDGSPVSPTVILPTAVSEAVTDLSIPHISMQVDTVVSGLTSGKDIVNVFVEDDSHAKVDADVDIHVGCDYEMSFDGAASFSAETSRVFDMGPVTIKNKKWKRIAQQQHGNDIVPCTNIAKGKRLFEVAVITDTVLDGPLIPPRQQVGRRFQFNACWIHEKVCEDLVAESWSRVGEISNDVVRAVLGAG